jgi:hypothetical protein
MPGFQLTTGRLSCTCSYVESGGRERGWGAQALTTLEERAGGSPIYRSNGG